MLRAMQSPTLAYVILYVPNVEQSLSFYERAFGLKRRFVHESGTYAELETGATALAFAEETSTPTANVFALNGPGEKPAGVEVALVVQDVPAAHSRALEAGALEVTKPETKPWGQVVSYVRDADGVLVELCTSMG